MSTDDSLAQRARSGDASAFGALVREHQSKVRGFLRRLTRGDAALADDLAQETFLEAHRKIAQFRGEGSFGAWLCGIAWSRFLMERRKRREEPLEAPDETASVDTDIGESRTARSGKGDGAACADGNAPRSRSAMRSAIRMAKPRRF